MELVELLAKWQLPYLTEMDLSSLLAKRHSKAQSRHESVLGPENAGAVEQLVAAEDDLADLKETVAKRCAKRAAPADDKRASTSTTPPDEDSAVPSAAPPSAGPSRIAQKRPLPDTDHTVPEARSYCPPGAWTDTHSGKAWQAKCPARPELPNSHTVTFGQTSGVSKHAALARCLRWAWESHQQVADEECPWQL